MAPFRLPADENRLDWEILRDGGIALYWRPTYLKEDIDWLRQQNYQVFSFACDGWTSSEVMHADFQRVLAFPDWYGGNLNALEDSLCNGQLAVPDAGGAVIVLNRFDAYAGGSGASGQLEAEIVLDILARASRYFLLTGQRLLTLIQSDNPQIHFEKLGSVATMWNRREWLDKDRGR